MADRTPGSRSQDDRRFPARQRPGHSQDLRAVRRAVPPDRRPEGRCVAVDGSKFKAVNNRDRNFTKGKIASRFAHLEAEVGRYIEEMVRIDRQEEGEARAEKVAHLARRYRRIRQEIERLQAMDEALADAPDGQISLTDPDARAMATSARAQRACRLQRSERGRHRDPSDRHPRGYQPGPRPRSARPRWRRAAKAVARPRGSARHRRQGLLQRPRDPRLPRGRHHHDRAAPGYLRQPDQGHVREGRLRLRPDGMSIAAPPANALTYRYTREEDGLQLRRYWINDCQYCPLQPRCTSGKERRITRWEHEHLIDEMRQRLGRDPEGPAAVLAGEFLPGAPSVGRAGYPRIGAAVLGVLAARRFHFCLASIAPRGGGHLTGPPAGRPPTPRGVGVDRSRWATPYCPQIVRTSSPG